MKRVIILAILTCVASFASAQYKVVPNKPFSTLNSSPGFITINELTGGIGLNGKTAQFSKYFFGLTSINGYQVNRNFIFAGGAGLYFYESGLLIPLFLDFRFAFNISKLTPYVFADGGLLLNVEEFNSTQLFINPGAGARYTLNRKLAVNLGAGILSQVSGKVRESFVNLKVGGVYKF